MKMQQKLQRYHWITGLVIGLVILSLAQLPFFGQLEDRLASLGTMPANHSAGSDVAVIAIDDATIEAVGGWSLPQPAITELIQAANNAGAHTVGVAFPLDTLRSEASAALEKARNYAERSDVEGLVDCNSADIDCSEPLPPGKFAEFREGWQDLKKILTGLAAEETHGSFISGLIYQQHHQTAQPTNALMQAAVANAPNSSVINNIPRATHFSRVPENLQGMVTFGAPLPPNSDNSRKAPLIVGHADGWFATLPLALVLQKQNIKTSAVELQPSKIKAGELEIPTDSAFQMMTFPYQDIPVIVAKDIQASITSEKLKDKIVLIGLDVTADAVPGNVMAATPNVITLAQQVATLLQQDFIITPMWTVGLGLVLALAATFYIALLLPSLKLRNEIAWAFTTSLIIILLIAGFFFVDLYRVHVPLLAPICILLFGHIIFSLIHGWIYYRDHVFTNKTEEEYRQQALSYHGQGRLEEAFETLARCPTNDLNMSLMYNLGLDFERKRKARQAIEVYQYMVNQDPEYRDVERRMLRLGQMKRHRLPGSTSDNISLWLEQGDEFHKPTLGRYQIEKRLAKGAMGMVYLGQDPRLDRMVAIKTLALSEEFEGDELQEATTRFFREASAAGRLHHPAIIAVYDAGEEHDLAYISMEFFKGGDLGAYTRPNNLLPIDVVFDLTIKAAEALDYAHQQGVIHRDIKPTNILRNPTTGEIRITDFGIARITDTKKTKTGIILGTPSYMSPEQLAGKEVDGRSDLFSLGVMFYQLLCGDLPFTAESMTSLMFKIASESHPDILSLRHDLPACVKPIIDKLLQKEAEQRFTDGAELIAELNQCRALIKTSSFDTVPSQTEAGELPTKNMDIDA